MNRNRMRIKTCCLASAIVLTSSTLAVNAAPAAGLSSQLSSSISSEVSETTVAGGSLSFAKAIANSQQASAKQENETPVVKSEYADIAIAQVDNYVNVRSTPGEDGEVLGKLYNNSAATVDAVEGDWYKITSGNVTGYVKQEFVVVGNEELAKSVGRRLATVNTETLKVRTDASMDASVLGLVPGGDDLTVLEELDGWVKVTMEEGEGYVSTDYVTLSTDYVTAESKAEEEARLAKEEAERKAAEEAARKASQKAAQKSSGSKSSGGSSNYSAPSGSGGAAVANYACQFVGNPYVYGGTSLTNGADCSGFVMSVYAQFGISLPHSSSGMRSVGYEVSQSEMQPGDIICYSGHVAIYVGNDTIVHASTPSTGIKYTSPAAYKSIITVRRIF
ncbi:MAG: SH3 domain-containing C40 family peptidase [Lachnospiraceae bacterium]|nr:C40 family peptidase [Lachnospiraceae bacterium]MDD7379065.1 SH3 domain-containing C40 family peptidase [Lachnospiraceae bacterium]MDY4616481.1 SH3 domain-containing C40 family peptidase [Lachnospiraceae bacterium]